MRFFDHMTLGANAEIANAREMANGNLLVTARAARGGNIQDYLGAEVGRPDLGVVRIYRDADEVFRAESLKTFGHKPVTLDHPPAPVTPDTWGGVARGHVGDEVVRDGEFVRIPMMLADRSAIDDVKSGRRREISAGYVCSLDWTPGTTADGRPYDARQTRIVVDHVAIVARGRAGPDCRIGDERPADGKTMRALDQFTPPQPQQRTPTRMTERTIVVDSHTITVNDAAAIVVAGLQRTNQALVADNLTLTGKLTTTQTAHATAITAKDAEIAGVRREVETKDGQIAALTRQLQDATAPAALDALLVARDAVKTKARALLGDSATFDGKSNAQIQRDVVVAKLGDGFKDLPDTTIDGAFRALDATPRDQLRDAISGGIVPAGGTSLQDKAYGEMVAGYQDAWKTPAPRAA